MTWASVYSVSGYSCASYFFHRYDRRIFRVKHAWGGVVWGWGGGGLGQGTDWHDEQGSTFD